MKIFSFNNYSEKLFELIIFWLQTSDGWHRSLRRNTCTEIKKASLVSQSKFQIKFKHFKYTISSIKLIRSKSKQLVNILYIILSVFAVWRLTHLLGKEDGPFDIIFLIRKKAGNSFFGKLMDCFYCLSIWIALPFGIWLGTNWIERILVWLALSGAACLLEQATIKKGSSNNINYHED